LCILTKIPEEGFSQLFKPEGVDGMASNFSTSEPKDKQMRRSVSVIAWIAWIVGVILILTNLGNLSDRNVFLMVGIGCVVGGFFIYIIGKSLSIARKKEDQENGRS
jgi:1,4-dihydroxy-2-naphthoate octaprenyltransferase